MTFKTSLKNYLYNKVLLLLALITFIFTTSFHSITPLETETSKDLYIHFTIDSNSYSFLDIRGPFCGGNAHHCGRKETVWSNAVSEHNGGRVQVNFALPKTPKSLSDYELNKKYHITSNEHMVGEFCPFLFWIGYRPDINSEKGYFSTDNDNLDEQYVIYTAIEKGKPDPRYGLQNNYYITGYFQCYVKEHNSSPSKIMKGKFRVKVCLDNMAE